jgi:carbonic anhydrase/acetyltransferase-like protein (isoleucine patch superfamily)
MGPSGLADYCHANMDVRAGMRGWKETTVQKGYDRLCLHGSVGPQSRRGKLFNQFGQGSIIMFPWVTLYGEKWMNIGANTMIGQHCALGVGMTPDQEMMSTPVISIGDRCLIGRGSGIVAHWNVHIGNDVFTGHNVYITDQNHGYEDVSKPIGAQTMPEKAVRIGDGSWIGHGAIILPGVELGEHVTVAGGSVVTKSVPARCVVAGNPARIVKQYDDSTETWKTLGRG